MRCCADVSWHYHSVQWLESVHRLDCRPTRSSTHRTGEHYREHSMLACTLLVVLHELAKASHSAERASSVSPTCCMLNFMMPRSVSALLFSQMRGQAMTVASTYKSRAMGGAASLSASFCSCTRPALLPLPCTDSRALSSCVLPWQRLTHPRRRAAHGICCKRTARAAAQLHIRSGHMSWQ